MLFSELYSAYYRTVAEVIKAAVRRPQSREEIRKIVEDKAFGESILNICPAIESERWQLIRKDGSTPLEHEPSLPMTDLEKRWLKAIFEDPKVRLFTDEDPELGDAAPLFSPGDVIVFDKYLDGDPYTDEEYIRNFRLILDALKNQYPLSIDTSNRKGNISHTVLVPKQLEYSEKDDKFRMIGADGRGIATVNLGRIKSCSRYPGEIKVKEIEGAEPQLRTVEFELFDDRKALERVLLHFAHFKKQAEKIGDRKYKVSVTYDKDDETELVIRILSFGPMVRVTAPERFVGLIKDRLKRQMSLGQ